jgi:hypothetical protein
MEKEFVYTPEVFMQMAIERRKHQRLCHWCGLPFKPRSIKHRFHSHDCYLEAKKDRRNAARRRRYAEDEAYREREIARRLRLYHKEEKRWSKYFEGCEDVEATWIDGTKHPPLRRK